MQYGSEAGSKQKILMNSWKKDADRVNTLQLKGRD